MKSKEFIILQLSKSIDTFNDQYALLTRIIIGMIAANLTILGFSNQANYCILLLVGAGLMASGLIITKHIRRAMIPLIYVSLNLEKRINDNYPDEKNYDFLSTTYIKFIDAKSAQKMIEIGSIDDDDERLNQLRSVKTLGSSKQYTIIIYFFYFALITQLLLASCILLKNFI